MDVRDTQYATAIPRLAKYVGENPNLPSAAPESLPLDTRVYAWEGQDQKVRVYNSARENGFRNIIPGPAPAGATGERYVWLTSVHTYAIQRIEYI